MSGCCPGSNEFFQAKWSGMKRKSITVDLGGGGLSAVYTPTLDAAGVVDGWVAVVIDTTERKRLEDELKVADRRKTSSWRRSRTNCATRWPRFATPWKS